MALERRGKPAFNSNPDTGRMGYRTEVEAADERPLVIYPHSQWRDEDERLAYERAAREVRPWEHYEVPEDWDPEDKTSKAQTGFVWMGMARLCEEIVSLAAGLDTGLKRMPHARMSRVERDRQLQKLRGQMPRGTEVL